MKFGPYFFFTCNPRCISHVDYWCTFSGDGERRAKGAGGQKGPLMIF